MSSSHETPNWPGSGENPEPRQPAPPPPPPPPAPPGWQGEGARDGLTRPGAGYQAGPAYPAGLSYPGGPGYPEGYPGGPSYPAGPGYPNGPGYPAGPGYPGGQAYPGQPGQPGQGWPGQPGRRHHRLRRGLIVAVVAAAVGAGSTFLGLQHGGGTTGSTVLTTAQVANKVDPGLVDIVTTLGYQRAQAAGTGMVLTSSGEVLTNNHVIEGATSIQATDIGNGQTYTAKVVGYDRSHDVAVISLQNATGLQTVTLGSSDAAQPGQKVVALGNAEGKGGTPSVVTGQILSLNAAITASDASAGTSERLTGLIRHDAAIQPGDSGGPLVNTAGEVIGIDTAASTSDFQIQGGTNETQGFAIPINHAISIAKLIGTGTSSDDVHIGATGFVGVEVASTQQAEGDGVRAGSGVLVTGLVSGSPAQQAGLAAGDVITSVNGGHVASALTLQTALQKRHPGDRVSIGFTTPSGHHQTVTVQLTNGPAG